MRPQAGIRPPDQLRLTAGLPNDRLGKLAEEIQRWSIRIDADAIGFEASRRLDEFVERLASDPKDTGIMETMGRMLGVLKGIPIKLNLWKAQNVHFNIGRQMLAEISRSADAGDSAAAKWRDDYTALGNLMQTMNS